MRAGGAPGGWRRCDGGLGSALAARSRPCVLFLVSPLRSRVPLREKKTGGAVPIYDAGGAKRRLPPRGAHREKPGRRI